MCTISFKRHGFSSFNCLFLDFIFQRRCAGQDTPQLIPALGSHPTIASDPGRHCCIMTSKFVSRSWSPPKALPYPQLKRRVEGTAHSTAHNVHTFALLNTTSVG